MKLGDLGQRLLLFKNSFYTMGCRLSAKQVNFSQWVRMWCILRPMVTPLTESHSFPNRVTLVVFVWTGSFGFSRGSRFSQFGWSEKSNLQDWTESIKLSIYNIKPLWDTEINIMTITGYSLLLILFTVFLYIKIWWGNLKSCRQ